MDSLAKSAARRLEDPRASALAAVGALGLALWLLAATATGGADLWLFEACRAFLAGEAAPIASAPAAAEARLYLELWAMWALMMAAMALPALAGTLAAFADLAALEARRDGGTAAGRLAAFLGGWLAVWTLAAAGFAATQFGLRAGGLLAFGGAAAAPAAGGALLLLGGFWQLSAARSGCLAKCRSPMAFLMAEWRPGPSGAARLGLRHGRHCLGCCLAPAAAMLAFGSMNLWWMMAIALWGLVERLAPWGENAARWAGAAMIGAGAATLAAAPW